MQQQQIDLRNAQPGQAVLGRSLEIIRRKMGGPDLGRDEHIVASHSRSAQALANLAFVLIDLRGVDVAVAEPQRLLDQTRAGSPPQLPGAEPDRGNFGAVGLDELHCTYSDKPSSLCRADVALPTLPKASSAFRSQVSRARERQTPSRAHGKS